MCEEVWRLCSTNTGGAEDSSVWVWDQNARDARVGYKCFGPVSEASHWYKEYLYRKNPLYPLSEISTVLQHQTTIDLARQVNEITNTS